MRKGSIIIWLTFLLTVIVTIFWRVELVYSLPTPVPLNYKSVDLGKKIILPTQLIQDQSKPAFLHFFNPSCPCSRFNMAHFKSLVKQYGDKINFTIVVLNNEYTEKNIQDKFDLKIPVTFDTTLTTLCGVYSTPQAVLIDKNQQLFYRGNYNRTRYCSDKKTEYARIAIEALLHNNINTWFDQYARTAYGCRIPKCTD